MGVSKEQLSSIIAGKAAALCRPELDNAKSVSRGQVNEGFGGPDPSAYDGDAARWDSMFSDYAGEDYQMPTAAPTRDISYSEAGAARSQMPEAIKESMMKNKIDVSKLSNQSVLDTLGIRGKKTTAPTQQRQVVTEQTYQSQPAAGGVDYSIIKAVVSECIKEYFKSQPLNESSIKTIGLGKGAIKIVDASGNVFQAKLEKIGNVNDKKK